MAKSIFSMVVDEARTGLVLKPKLHSFLYDAVWPDDFSVRFKRGAMSREPDGWFHPSTHPTWTERQLWYYRNRVEDLEPDHFAFENTMSVTMGTAIHGFMETCLNFMGVTYTRTELSGAGYQVRNGEPYFEDQATMSRGNADGVLHLPGRPDELFEFKTTGERNVKSVKDMDLDAFVDKWPWYYAQQQEYQRLSGLRNSIVIIMAMGFPWELREFHIPANQEYQDMVRDKYLRVLEATGVPAPCEGCVPKAKIALKCPARNFCPVLEPVSATR